MHLFEVLYVLTCQKDFHPAKLKISDINHDCTKHVVSNSLSVHTADPPRITNHPQGLKDIIPGQPVSFTIQAEGTEPLNFQWQQKPRGGSEGWQVCDVERFPGADNSTLTIPSAQKLNEGSYRCTVNNCADSESSELAALTMGELKYYVYVIEHNFVVC